MVYRGVMQCVDVAGRTIASVMMMCGRMWMPLVGGFRGKALADSWLTDGEGLGAGGFGVGWRLCKCIGQGNEYAEKRSGFNGTVGRNSGRKRGKT